MRAIAHLDLFPRTHNQVSTAPTRNAPSAVNGGKTTYQGRSAQLTERCSHQHQPENVKAATAAPTAQSRMSSREVVFIVVGL